MKTIWNVTRNFTLWCSKLTRLYYRSVHVSVISWKFIGEYKISNKWRADEESPEKQIYAQENFIKFQKIRPHIFFKSEGISVNFGRQKLNDA